jgi:hypothetical protein
MSQNRRAPLQLFRYRKWSFHVSVNEQDCAILPFEGSQYLLSSLTNGGPYREETLKFPQIPLRLLS